jgi:hypothetical protein
MYPPAQAAQHIARIGGVDRLSHDPVTIGDGGVSSKDQFIWLGKQACGSRLVFCQTHDIPVWRFSWQWTLVNIYRANIKHPAGERKKLASARRI